MSYYRSSSNDEDKVIDQRVEVTTPPQEIVANFYVNVDLMDIPNVLEWKGRPGHSMDLYLDNRQIGVLFSYADSLIKPNGIELGFYVDGVSNVQRLCERYKLGEFNIRFSMDPVNNRVRMYLCTKEETK